MCVRVQRLSHMTKMTYSDFWIRNLPLLRSLVVYFAGWCATFQLGSFFGRLCFFSLGRKLVGLLRGKYPSVIAKYPLGYASGVLCNDLGVLFPEVALKVHARG